MTFQTASGTQAWGCQLSIRNRVWRQAGGTAQRTVYSDGNCTGAQEPGSVPKDVREARGGAVVASAAFGDPLPVLEGWPH